MRLLIYRLVCGVIIGSLEVGSLGTVSLAQAPTETNTEFFPPQPPNPTFGVSDIPPTSPSPPEFNPLTSEQFNLYRLDLGDTITVTVQNFPEFNFSTIIDPEGRVFVPILGRIRIVGLTLDEVETKIAYELGRVYLQQEPEVIAVLANPRPAQVIILGEIFRPGYYAFDAGTPLNAIIASAGGSTPQADLRSVIVRRPLIDGTILEERVDLYTPLVQGTRFPDLRLQGGDTIILSRLETGQEQGYDRNVVAQTNLTQQTITVRVLVQLNPSGRQLRNVSLPSGSTFLDLVGILPAGDRLRIRNEVTLMRFDTEQGRVTTQTLNPESLVLSGDVTQDVPLRDQDVIITNRTLLGEVLSLFRIITQPIRDIFGFTDIFRRFDSNRGFF